MPPTKKSFVPPLAAKLARTPGNVTSRAASAPAFIPPFAAKIFPPIKPPARAAAAMPERLNLAQAARYLGVSEPTMAKLAKQIPHLHVGRVRRFDKAVLDDVLRGRQPCRTVA